MNHPMPPLQGACTDLFIDNVQVLTPNGWQHDSSLWLSEGRIRAVGAAPESPSVKRIDAGGACALPGIIDLHGDAFERHITPRAGTEFPLELALAANDASLVANGITTFFYSITDGFEPGPRSRGTVRRLLTALERLQPRFACQARVHIRHEQVNTAGHEELRAWLEAGRIHLLSLNDHLPPMDDPKKIDRYLAGLHRRVSLSESETRAFLASRQADRELGRQQEQELAAIARSHGIALASHDDESLEDVERAISLGTSIAEFPMTLETARASQAAGIPVLMGAPNLVRGGSHVGAVSVREAVRYSAVDILCSDYHYPSLFSAPFTLAGLGIMPLEQAWKLVSENPARAAGFCQSKGKLQAGHDADLLLVSELDGSPLSLSATVVGGALVYQRAPSAMAEQAAWLAH